MNDIVHETSDTGGTFTIFIDGQKAGYISYVFIDEKSIDADHTKVYPEFESKGVGKRLLSALVEYARANGLKVKPSCSFVDHAFNKNNDYDDLKIV